MMSDSADIAADKAERIEQLESKILRRRHFEAGAGASVRAERPAAKLLEPHGLVANDVVVGRDR